MATQFDFPEVSITFFVGADRKQLVEITQGTRQIVLPVRDFNRAFNSREVDAETIRRLSFENKRECGRGASLALGVE